MIENNAKRKTKFCEKMDFTSPRENFVTFLRQKDLVN